ncbi:hypothetical protein [Lysobacter brunescens]|uniref:Peptidase S74 domain-containing protein n=1 Tax=Lysobacter brunescens TaxID=262323 RepID=A0ABW2YHC6_9GAMM
MQLRITAAGRAALRNNQGTGTQETVIAEIGLTATAFNPSTATSLPGEIKRVTSFGGDVVDEETIHVTIVDNTTDTYSLRGLAAYLDDGTLFAIGGDENAANVITEKASAAQLLLSVDVRLAELTTATITFSGGGFTNPPASETVLGVTRRSSTLQAIGGVNTDTAMAPATTKAQIDDRFGAEAPSALTKTMLARTTAAQLRSDLGLKSAALKDEGTGNGLDADTLDGLQATAFLLATSRGANGGVAPLDAGGKVPESYLPSIAVVDVFPVASQAAQLALSAQRGDVAVRTDLNRSYMRNAGTSGTMSDWTELRTPTDAVLSVAGKTGAVALVIADIGGLQLALDAKANLSGATFTGTVAAPTFNGTSAPPSSERYKELIRGIDPADAMQILRDIGFCWYRMRESGLESAGVIAERLADGPLDFCVLRDAQGRPDGVNYHPLFTVACAAVLDIDRRLRAIEESR